MNNERRHKKPKRRDSKLEMVINFCVRGIRRLNAIKKRFGGA